MGFGVRSGAAVVRAEIARRATERRQPSDPAGFPEIDCVRARFPRDVLAAAERRAARLGVGADRVLVAAGRLDEETYLRALADSLGAGFEPLGGIARDLCPIDDERLVQSAAAGLLPLAIDDVLYLVVAPRGIAARRIVAMVGNQPTRAQRFRFTIPERLNRFVMRHAGAALAARACEQLQRSWPMFSAAPKRSPGNVVPAAMLGLAALAALIVAPATSLLIVDVMLAAVFLAWLALRLIGVFVGAPTRDRPSRLPDDGLPVYTVIVALYREAASVDGLLSAIERLDYPGIMAQTPQDI